VQQDVKRKDKNERSNDDPPIFSFYLEGVPMSGAPRVKGAYIITMRGKEKRRILGHHLIIQPDKETNKLILISRKIRS